MKKLLFIALTILSFSAFAHKASDATLLIQTRDQALGELTYSIALRDLEQVFIQLDENQDRTLTLSELQATTPAIEKWINQGLTLQCDEQALELKWQYSGVERLSEGMNARFQAGDSSPCAAPKVLSVKYSLMGELDPEHRLLLSTQVVSKGSASGVQVISPDGGWHLVTLPNQQNLGTKLETLAGFIALGFKHILLGADHIAFVLCLVLGIAMIERWRALVVTITAFTLGHSITLLAATLGWVVSPFWVEPAIALSVVAVALMNLFPALVPRLQHDSTRAIVGCLFGMIHGLGFSGAMVEAAIPVGSILWALAGFNLGVELGQLLIVAAWLAVYLLLSKKKIYSEMVVPLGSVTLLLLAVYWFIERTGGEV